MQSICTPPVVSLPGVPQALAWLRMQGDQGATGLCLDSRRVQSGDAFVAWPGWATDGRKFVSSALQAGAVAALVDEDGLDAWLPQWHAAAHTHGKVASLRNLKACTGELASAFFDQPSQHLNVVAVTGTNGKTSTAWWLAQALSVMGRSCGMAGTLGMGLPPLPGFQTGERAHGHGDWRAGFIPTGLTTPDPVTWQQQLRQWVKSGVQACVVEASSIGLQELRLDGTRFAVAMFTNFTQDHLDYHGSMDAYWASKARLFQWPDLGAAVVNVDDDHGAQLALQLASQQPNLPLWTVSVSAQATPVPANLGGQLYAEDLRATATGMAMTVVERRGGSTRPTNLTVPFVGRYNASNLLGVVAAMRALGVDLGDAVQACERVTAVPGRMEPVTDGQAGRPLVLVDYAHTPDAVAQALAAIRPLAQVRGGRLHCVVGCGGDRDAAKRPLMAAAAEAGCDGLCLTSDNPRSEDPVHILRQMQAGLSRPQDAALQPDRALAIAQTMARAQPADVVLIAGKGHEATQEIVGQKFPFSDAQQVLLALQSIGEGRI